MGKVPTVGAVCIQNSNTHIYRSFSIYVDVQKTAHFNFSHPRLFDPGTYQAQLQAKLAQLHDLVETNSPKLATPKRPHSTPPSFKDGDPVWLSVPTAGTLQPRWKGNCRIKTVKSPITWKSQITKLTRYQTSLRKLKSGCLHYNKYKDKAMTMLATKGLH